MPTRKAQCAGDILPVESLFDEHLLLDLSDEANLYAGCSGLLKAVKKPPQLVETVVQSLDMAELRAYPMLTARGSWSMRVEGLEIGRFRDGRGWLDVGKDAGSGAAERRARPERSGSRRQPCTIATASRKAEGAAGCCAQHAAASRFRDTPPCSRHHNSARMAIMERNL